ncbi:MAG: zinc-ribbon domain-containing protein [Spirochaetaceae bacterium]|nr:zinc-ribbon domain-containing protein [Spirochaetaceae bacterium]
MIEVLLRRLREFRPPSLRARGGRSRRAIGLAVLLAIGLPTAIATAQHPGGEGGQAPPPPAGPASIEVQVVHETDPERAAGLSVALYALGPDGTPGLANGKTDATGRQVFPGLSNDPGIVYLVGVRYRDIPFGERLLFEPGQQSARVEMHIADPTEAATGVRVEELRARIDWAGDRLLVREILRLSNPSGRVVLRSGPDPARAIVRRPLPATARDFAPGATSIGDGLAEADGVVAFYGPLYPGEQRIEYQYSMPLPTTGDARRATLPIELGSPAERVVIVAGTKGIAADGPSLVASQEVASDAGEPLAAWARSRLAAGERLDVALTLPEGRFDPSLVRIPRGDVWLELDDTRLTATVDLNLQVADGPPVSGTPDAPLLHVRLPRGATLNGVAPEAEALGLVPTNDGGFDVIGPIASGATSLGYSYRLPAGPEGLSLDLEFPREVETLNVLIADTGLAVASNRLHRRRPFRNRTRNYLHREAFNVGPDDPVDLSIEPLRATGVPRPAAAALAIAGAGAAALFLAAPLRARRSEPTRVAPETLRLRTELEAIYAEIHDLDHDHETGKLEAADHERMRATLRRRAIALLRAERTGMPAEPSASGSPTAAPTDGAPAIAGAPVPDAQPVVRATPPAQASATPPAHASTTAPDRTGDVPAPAAKRFCTHCGEPVRPAWRFCSHCGGRLEESPESSA